MYDVVIVGGGAAGLAGALSLARARRRVLIVDEGRPRNAPAEHMHNFLTRDGMPPEEFLALGRKEVQGYGAEIRSARVVSAKPGFTVELDDGTSVEARRLLITTGLTDELPDVPGLRERWGRDVVHCPYCHGWEVRDQPIGVIATSEAGVHQALLFRQWTPNVTLLRHTGPQLSAADAQRLGERGIRVIDGEVTGLEITDDQLTGVRVAGEVVPVRVAVVMPRVGANLVPGLGLTVAEHPFGSYLPADPTGKTDVPGVWAAGNLTDPKLQVIGAAAAGSLAGAVLNADLLGLN